MPTSVVEDFDRMFNAMKRWAKGMELSDDTLVIAATGLMVYDIERRGWLNRSEELQRAQRIAQAARDAITKELT